MTTSNISFTYKQTPFDTLAYTQQSIATTQPIYSDLDAISSL